MTVTVTHPRRNLQRRWRVTSPLRWMLREIPLPRGRYWSARNLARLYPRNAETFKVEVGPDRTLTFRYDEEVARQILFFGAFESAETEYFVTTARRGTIIDVGANVGYMTASAASRRPDLTVVAVEPIQRNVERLASATTGLRNVLVVPCALGTSEGTLRMDASEDGALAAVSANGSVEVPVRRLDDVWAEQGRPEVAVVKLDVEGFEPQVLRGATELLLSEHPALIVEAWGPENLRELDDVLVPYGYSRSRPPRFESWNYVYTVRAER